MAILIGLAVGLIVAGLLMCWLHSSVRGVLATIVYWTGVILIIVGLILLFTPVIVWLNAQLRAMLGQG